MNHTIIKTLNDLRSGESIPIHKPNGGIEKEKFNTLSKLKNLGVLKTEKRKGHSVYLVEDSILLSKFIELKDFDKLIDYIENMSSKKSSIETLTPNKESTFYDGIWNRIKQNKLLSILLFICVAIFAVIQFFNQSIEAKKNLEDLNNDSIKKSNLTEIKKAKKVSDRIIQDTADLKYLENIPILDKGIYLRHNYNNLQVGGSNIDSLKINARTYDGEPLQIEWNQSTLEFPIHEKPYLEILYKGNHYSIQILGKIYNYKYVLSEMTVPTLYLKEVTIKKEEE